MNEKILLTVGMALVLLSMAALPALAEEECSVGTILLSDTECQGNSLCNVRKCCGLVSGSLDCTVLDSVCDSCGVTTNARSRKAKPRNVSTASLTAKS